MVYLWVVATMLLFEIAVTGYTMVRLAEKKMTMLDIYIFFGVMGIGLTTSVLAAMTLIVRTAL